MIARRQRNYLLGPDPAGWQTGDRALQRSPLSDLGGESAGFASSRRSNMNYVIQLRYPAKSAACPRVKRLALDPPIHHTPHHPIPPILPQIATIESR